MIEFRVTNTFTYVNPATLSLTTYRIIDKVCSYKESNYWRTYRYKKGLWDGIVRLFKNYTFPTGLLSDVTRALDKKGYEYNIVDIRDKEEIEWREVKLKGIELRDYQIEALNIARNKERGIFLHSVSSGKTYEVAGLIQQLNFVKSLYVVHRLDLVIQSKKVLDKVLGIESGVIGGGYYEPRQVTVATVETLYSRVKEIDDYLKSVRFVYWDECHISTSASHWNTVSYSLSNAYWRYGGTGSIPTDISKFIRLKSATGEIIHKVTSKDLIERGLIVKPNITIITINNPKVANNEWNKVYEEGIVKNNIRNMIIVEEVAKREKVLCLVTRIEHGKRLEKIMEEKGIKSKFIYGTHDLDTRKRYYNKLRKGKIQCLIASTIADEGLNIKEIRTIVLAGGGASEIKLVQRIGRGMRLDKDKDKIDIIDFFDKTNKILYYHSMKRFRKYKEEGWKIKEV